jgi:hypothetical protein
MMKAPMIAEAIGRPMAEMGHLRPIDDVCMTSAFPPIATDLLHYGNGRKGP